MKQQQEKQRYQKAFDRLQFSADFEQRTRDLLRQHACQTEKEPNTMKLNHKISRKAVALAAVAAALVGAVSAAALWLSPAQVARHYDEPALAQAFESKDAILLDETIETGDYAVTLLGLVSGKDLAGWNQDTQESHTYAVVALKRLDGQPLDNQTFDFINFTLTPLVSGYAPQAVNNWTLDAFATGFAQDGLFYYLLDTQDLNLFAHRTVYLAFYEGGSPSNSTFFVAEDGQISFREGFEGVHALFTLPLDPSKGDPAAADAFAESTGLNQWMNLEDCPPEEGEIDPDDFVTFEEVKD